MNLFVGLLALFFLFFLPGYLTARALFRDGDVLSSGERVYLPVAVSILISTWIGLILAEFGWFSLWLLCLLVALYCALMWLAGRKTPPFLPFLRGGVKTILPPPSPRTEARDPIPPPSPRVEARDPIPSPSPRTEARDLSLPPLRRGDQRGVSVDWVFIAILALGAVLAAHPAEYILGNYDASTYVNVGAIIARTGAIAIHDPLVQSLAPDPGRQFFLDLVNPFMLYTQLRLPGFFIADAAQGLVLPQFLHLYPVWLAIFDAALGLRLGLYATPVIGLLGSVAAYFVARTLFGRKLALLAFFLLVIDVPQFWFARYPVAEAMTQFLLLTGMYAFLRSPALSFSRGREYNSHPNLNPYSHPNINPYSRPNTEPNSQELGRELYSRPADSSRTPSFAFPLIAGTAFAEIFLARADAILLLAPLGIYALIVIFTRHWRREHWALFLSFGFVFVHAVVHIWVFAPDYIYFQYSHFLRMKNLDKLLPGGTGLPSAQDLLRHPASFLPLLAVVMIGIVALFVVDRIAQVGLRRWGTRLYSWVDRYSSPSRWIIAALIVVVFILAYFVIPRPQTWYAYVGGETPLDRSANLIKLGWYLSPFGLALAVVGAAVVVLRDLSRHNLFFFGTGALFTGFYLEELYSNPHYIYTMRHYIPLIIPLFILLAARALQFLWSIRSRHLQIGGGMALPPLLPRVAAGGALALWLAYNVYAMGLIEASRATGIALRVPFVEQTSQFGPLRLDPLGDSIVGVAELGGAIDQIEALANQIDPNAVIIFSNNRDEPALTATPLHFLFNRDALVARFNQPNGDKIAALIDGWRAQGREVILAFGTNGGKLAVPGYSLSLLGHFALDVPQWAFAYQYMPRAAWRVNLNYALYRALPSSVATTYPFTIDFGGDDYPSLDGGFLERATGASARSMGVNPDPGAPRPKAKNLTATLRVPDDGAHSTSLDLALTARAPQDNMTLLVKSGKASFGQVKLTRDYATYHFALTRAGLQRDGDTFLIELSTPAFTDPGGLILGAELKKAVVGEQ